MCSHVEADSIDRLPFVTDDKNGTVILSRQQETCWHFAGEPQSQGSYKMGLRSSLPPWKGAENTFLVIFNLDARSRVSGGCIRSSTRSCIRKKAKPRRTCLLLVITVHFSWVDRAKPICLIFTFNMSKQCLFAKLYQTKPSHRKISVLKSFECLQLPTQTTGISYLIP